MKAHKVRTCTAFDIHLHCEKQHKWQQQMRRTRVVNLLAGIGTLLCLEANIDVTRNIKGIMISTATLGIILDKTSKSKYGQRIINLLSIMKITRKRLTIAVPQYRLLEPELRSLYTKFLWYFKNSLGISSDKESVRRKYTTNPTLPKYFRVLLQSNKESQQAPQQCWPFWTMACFLGSQDCGFPPTSVYISICTMIMEMKWHS